MGYPWSLCPVDIAHFLVSLEAFWGFAEPAQHAADEHGCVWDGWEQDSFSALLQTKGTLFFQFIPQLSHL